MQSGLRAEIPEESHVGGSRDTGPQLAKCCHMSSPKQRPVHENKHSETKTSPPHSLPAAAHYVNTSHLKLGTSRGKGFQG